MRYRGLILITGLLLAAVSLGACSSDGTADSGGALVADETPVPEGMPVMYEFFTLT